MTESKNSDTKPKKSNYTMMEPAAPDDPIYNSGYVMLRPVNRKARSNLSKSEEIKEDTHSAQSKD